VLLNWNSPARVCKSWEISAWMCGVRLCVRGGDKTNINSSGTHFFFLVCISIAKAHDHLTVNRCCIIGQTTGEMSCLFSRGGRIYCFGRWDLAISAKVTIRSVESRNEWAKKKRPETIGTVSRCAMSHEINGTDRQTCDKCTRRDVTLRKTFRAPERCDFSHKNVVYHFSVVIYF
jgi:hypothetical protein